MIYYNNKIGKYIVIYIWITYFIYLIIPKRPVDKGLVELLTVTFLFLVSIAVLCGSNSVKISNIRKYSISKVATLFGQKKLAILQTVIIITTLGYLSDLFARGLGGFTLEFGENYEKMLNKEGGGGLSVWGQLYALLSPLRYILLSYGILKFSVLSRLNKALYIGLILSSISYSIFGLGTQKGVGDIIIIMSVTLLLNGIITNKLKEYKKKIIIVASVFIIFLSYMQASRSEVMGSGGITSNRYYEYDSNNILCNILGKSIGEGLINFGFYVSNGYPGLNYCLQEPFVWTYGYGSSRAANDYANRYLGLDSEFENTYPLRMEDDWGWPGLMFWPTAFSWWASDITWLGVIVLMFFYSKFMCILFKESLYYRNPLSIALFAYLSIGIIYLPANNQLMQSSANFISTITLIPVWLFYHKKFNHA